MTTKATRVALAGSSDLVRDLHGALTAAGMDVVADCVNRNEVVTAVQRATPDVCVVDRDLDGGGLIAVAAIACPRRRPAVLVIGAAAPGARRAARLAGAAAYLHRDSAPSAVVALVAQLAGKEQR